MDDFYEHFFLDKKSAKGNIKFILPKGVGKFEMVSDIDEAIVKKVLRNFGENK